MNKFTSKSVLATGLVAIALAFTATASAATFSTNLKQGSTGADVKSLQVILNSDAATQVSVSGAGAPGSETTYFGAATKAAVIKFQNKYASEVLTPAGLTSGTGFVGALTRSKLNTMGGSTTTTTTGCTTAFDPATGKPCSTTTTTTTQSGPVTVALANDNPAASSVVAGQATADLAHFAFSGNGTITNVKLVRTGISANSTLSNVYLYEGNSRVSDAASVSNTDGTITFNNLSITVAGSKTLAVKSDILTGTQGQIVGVTLTSFTTTGSAATTVNIAGNQMSVATADIATVSVGTETTNDASVNAGTNGYTFWSAPVTVSTRAAKLKGATFEYIGSAPTDALANARLYVNGTAVGPVSSISASNKLSFDFGSSPVTLNTGASTVEVRADIVKGSNRNVKFTLQNASDLVLADSQLNVNIAASGTVLSAGGVVTINSGSITTVIDPSFNSVTTVTGGSTGAVLGKFKLTAYGEDVKVQTLGVTITGADTNLAFTSLNNIALFYNGAQVGSSQNATGIVASSTTKSFSLGSSLIVAAGTPGILEVRADLQNSSSANFTSGTITAQLDLGSSNGQGQSSMNSTNVPAANVTTNGLTIAAGALSVAQSAAYAAAQVVNPNTSNVKIGSYSFQNTSSSESVRVTNLAVRLTTTGVLTNLSNLRTTETSGSGSTPINPSASNNFSVNFDLAAGQSKTIDIMADLGAATSSSSFTSHLTPTAMGVSSNVTVTVTEKDGQTITVQTGTLATPTLNPAPSSLSAQFVVGGSANLNVAQYNFVATNGNANITELKVTVGGAAVVAGQSPVSTITVAGQSAPVVSNIAYITGLNIPVTNGAAGANVNVAATFSAVGTNGVTSNQTATTSITYMKYTIGGTTTSTTTINVPSNTLTVVGTKPTVTIAGSTDALINGLIKLAEVTVAADAAGDLKLVTLPISISSTGVAVVASGTSAFTVKGTDGASIGNSNGAFTMTPSGTATSTITFTSPYTITAGTSKTFRIYGTAELVSGAVNTTSLSTKLGDSSLLLWNDMQGGVNNITGANIYNYPTESSVIHN